MVIDPENNSESLLNLSEDSERSHFKRLKADIDQNYSELKKRIQTLKALVDTHDVYDYDDQLNYTSNKNRYLLAVDREKKRYEVKQIPYFTHLVYTKTNLLTNHSEIVSSYIGKNQYSNVNSKIITPEESVIYDWFNDDWHNLADFEKPDLEQKELIRGEYKLTLKLIRKFNIEEGVLYGCYTTFQDGQPKYKNGELDPYVLKVLNKARSKNAKLTDIISTLQSEQNQIIRLNPQTNFVVQGCAGSGKTQILMHRLAYLQGRKLLRGTQDIYILTPSRHFNSFIQSVQNSLNLDPSRIHTFAVEDYYLDKLLNYLQRAGVKSLIRYEIKDETVLGEQFLHTVYSQDFYEETEDSISMLWDAVQSAHPYPFEILDAGFEIGLPAIENLEAGLQNLLEAQDETAIKTLSRLAKRIPEQQKLVQKTAESSAELGTSLLRAVIATKKGLLKSDSTSLRRTITTEKQGLLKHLRKNINLLLSNLQKITNTRDPKSNPDPQLLQLRTLLTEDLEKLKAKGTSQNLELFQLLGDQKSNFDQFMESYPFEPEVTATESSLSKAELEEIKVQLQENLKWQWWLIDRFKSLIQADSSLILTNEELCQDITSQLDSFEESIRAALRAENVISSKAVSEFERLLLEGTLPLLCPLAKALDYTDQVRKLIARKSSLFTTISQYKQLSEKNIDPNLDLQKLQNEIQELRHAWSWPMLYKNLIQSRLPKPIASRLSMDHLHYRFELYLNLMVASMAFARKDTGESMLNVDEAQDLSLAEYMMLQNINGSDSVFNLYGDENQNIYPYRGLNSWDELKNVLSLDTITINQNYRNPSNITKYCNKAFDMSVIPVGDPFDPVNDNCPTLLSAVKAFTDQLITHSRASCAIIYKNPGVKKQIEFIFEKNPAFQKSRIDDYPIYHISEAKGLEFNYVLAITEGMTHNEKYVAFTRALQQLMVYNNPNAKTSPTEEAQQNQPSPEMAFPKPAEEWPELLTDSTSSGQISSKAAINENLTTDPFSGADSYNAILSITEQSTNDKIGQAVTSALEKFEAQLAEESAKEKEIAQQSAQAQLSEQIQESTKAKESAQVEKSTEVEEPVHVLVSEEEQKNLQTLNSIEATESIQASEQTTDFQFEADQNSNQKEDLTEGLNEMRKEELKATSDEPKTIPVEETSVSVSSSESDDTLRTISAALPSVQKESTPAITAPETILTDGLATDYESVAAKCSPANQEVGDHKKIQFEGPAKEQNQTPLTLDALCTGSDLNTSNLDLTSKKENEEDSESKVNVLEETTNTEPTDSSVKQVQNKHRPHLQSCPKPSATMTRRLRKIIRSSSDAKSSDQLLQTASEEIHGGDQQELGVSSQQNLQHSSTTISERILQQSHSVLTSAKPAVTIHETVSLSKAELNQMVAQSVSELVGPLIANLTQTLQNHIEQTQQTLQTALLENMKEMNHASLDQINKVSESLKADLMASMNETIQSSLTKISTTAPDRSSQMRSSITADTYEGLASLTPSEPSLKNTSFDSNSTKKAVPVSRLIREVQFNRNLPLEVGDRIRHENLGTGVITKVRFNKVEVQFDTEAF